MSKKGTTTGEEFEDFLKIPQTIDKRNTDDKNRKVISVKDYSRRGVKS